MMRILVLSLLLLNSCASQDQKNTKNHPKDYLDQAEQACLKGNSADCSLYVKLYSVSRSPQEAKVLSNRECEKGNALYCYLESFLDYFNGRTDSAYTELKLQCDKNNLYSCHMLGYIQAERDSKFSKFQSNQYFDKACKGGDAKSCVTKAIYQYYVSKDIKVIKNFDFKNKPDNEITYLVLNIKESHPKLALEYASKYCAIGMQSFCYLKEQIEGKKSAEKYCQADVGLACEQSCKDQLDHKSHKAFNTCQNSCYKGHPDSCFQLAESELLVEDREEIERMYKLGCTFGDPRSCLQLGFFYEKTTRPDQSLAPYQVVCDLGYAYGCNRIAAHSGNNNDPDKALRAIQASCYFNDGTGCFSLGVKLHQDKSKDDRLFFEKSCKDGNENGCLALCALSAADKKIEQSKTYLIKACKDSNHVNCFPYQNKKPDQFEISRDELMKACSFDTKKPWWFWAAGSGAGILTGQIVN